VKKIRDRILKKVKNQNKRRVKKNPSPYFKKTKYGVNTTGKRKNKKK